MLGLGSLVVSAALGLNSILQRRDTRDNATNTQLQGLNDTLLEEIARLKAKVKEDKAECQELITDCMKQLESEREKRRALQELYSQQAERLGEVERLLREKR